MSTKRRIQDEGRAYKTHELRVSLCWYNQRNFCDCLPYIIQYNLQP